MCIGPYCQANTLGPSNALALIAGQIGLLAAPMVLPPRPPLPSSGSGGGGGGGGPHQNFATAATGGPVAAGGSGVAERGPSSFHGPEMRLCVSHASAVSSAVGSSLSRACAFATLYVSEEAAAAAAAAAAVVERVKAGSRVETSDDDDAGGGGGRSKLDDSRGSVGVDVPAAGGRGAAATEVSTGRIPAAAAAAVAAAAVAAANADCWLQGMVDECRELIEARFAQEQAEAAAANAGTGRAGDGDDGDDSAEDGWTSDPEELAKEAARKRVRWEMGERGSRWCSTAVWPRNVLPHFRLISGAIFSGACRSRRIVLSVPYEYRGSRICRLSERCCSSWGRDGDGGWKGGGG